MVEMWWWFLFSQSFQSLTFPPSIPPSLSPSLPSYVYDAVWLAAYGLDNVLSNSTQCTLGQRCIDGDSLIDALFYNVSFTGASSFVKSYEGMPLFADYARGDREDGHYYTAFNWQPDLFDTSPATTGGFAYMGQWYIADGTGTLTFCNDDVAGLQDYYGPSLDSSGTLMTHKCKMPVYNTFNGLPAPDTPPNIVIYIPEGASSFLFAWAALTFLVSVLCAVLTYEYGFTKLIKASQSEMMYALIAGGMCAGARILAAGLPLSDKTCGSLIWLGHLSFWMVFASLSIKSYRVHRIINNSGFKRIKFSKWDTLQMFGGVIISVIVFLIIECVVGEVHMSSHSTTVSNQTTELLLCTFRYTQFNTTHYVLEALCLLISARLCYAIKDAPDSINESKFIAMAMSVIILLIILAMCVVYLLDLVPWQREIVASAFFGLGAVAAQLIIVGPKAIILLQGMDVGGMDGKLVEQTRPVGGSQIIHMATAGMREKKKEEKEQRREARKEEQAKAQELMIAGVHIRGTFEEKVRVGREQIVKWRAYLMALEQSSDSGSGSGSGSGSTSSLGGMNTTHGGRNNSSVGEEDDDRAATSFRYKQRPTSLVPVDETEEIVETQTKTVEGV